MIQNSYKLLCIVILLSSKSVIGSGEYKSSLTFVVDDTFSMSDDIDEVKLGANAIFDTVLRHNASQIENFLLVTFNDDGHGDPGVVFRAKTKDREYFKNALSAIDVHGGDDCPEYSMAGIKRALEDSLDRSYLYVFTDATAKDYSEFEEVKAIAQKKQSQVVFVLTGQCDEPASSPAYRVYHDMAEATSGEVFHLRKSEVGKILEYVKKTITGRRTTLAVERLPPGKHNMTFNADVIMGELTLSLASAESADPSVTITAPDGSDVWKKILLETDQIQVYSVDVTMPGPHTVEVNSKAETRAVVSARSGLDFQHGFSAYKLPSLVDTSTRPAPGPKSHLSIKLNEGDILLQTVQILDMDDNVKLELPLEISNKKTKFYTTKAFDPPNTMFKIAIIGYDPKSKSNITRIASTPVEPQTIIPGKKIDDRAPIVLIEGEPIVHVDFDEPLQLVCKANGFPKPTIVWKNKDKGTDISGEVSVLELPYDYMSVLNIEKVQENVTYKCEANNMAGSDAKQVTVATVIRNKFNILDMPRRIQVKYKQKGQIFCVVDAYPPAEINWYKSGVKLTPSDNIEISGNKSIVTINQATPSDKGRYMCEARNKNKRKLIFRYVAVVGTEAPEIDKDANDLTVKRGSSTVIECKILKGIPKPSIGWYHTTGAYLQQTQEIEKWKNKERVTVTVNGKYDAGSYMCEAKNDIGSDYHETKITLEYPPTITKGVKLIRAASGSKLSIPCHADGGPPPHVTWYKDDVEITSSDKIHIFGDQTLRLVALSSDSGYYTCKATNTLGSVNKTVKVEVNIAVTIKPPRVSKLSALVGSALTLPCEASGDPKPNIKWIYRSFNTTSIPETIRSTEKVLQLDHIQISKDGYYTCIASNSGGSMNFTYEVHVLAPPFIKNIHRDKKIEAVEDDLALRIACEVSGIPKPTITWSKDGLNLALGSTFYVDKGTLIIKNVPRDASGTYTCEAKNSLGTAQEIYEITVHGYPPSSVPTSSILIEQGKLTEMTCGAPHNINDQLRWYKNGALIKEGKLTLTNPSVGDSGDYTCRVGDFFKSVSDTTRVIVGRKPEFTTSGDDENIEFLLEGPPITLSCENRGEPRPVVEWYLDGKKLNEMDPEHYSTIDLVSPGQYKCILKNPLGNITKMFNVSPRDCFVDTNKLTKSHPLMFSSSLEWPVFEKFEDSMVFSKGQQFIFFCPTRFKMFPQRYITAVCESGMNVIINGVKYDYSDIQCTEEVKHTVQRKKTKCMPGNTEKISIGYNIDGVDNAEVYEVCLNKTSETPIYAKHTMQSSLADDDYETSWSDGDQFRMNLDEAYDCLTQINTISSWLGRWFHNVDECCFSKRQLVSPRDVFPGAQQESTFSYFNVVPHWGTCNGDNWAEIERRVREFAKTSYSDLLVWTGTAKELAVKSFRGMATKYFADRKSNQQPVPMFLWKVIQDPASMSSIAIIHVNVPDLSSAETSRYILCKDHCDSTVWMKNSEWHDVGKGFTYCCSLEEFETAFGFKGIFEPNMASLLTSDALVLPESSLTAL